MKKSIIVLFFFCSVYGAQKEELRRADLRFFIRTNNIQQVHMALNENPQWLDSDQFGSTPLDCANLIPMAEYLIMRGVAINSRGVFDGNALTYFQNLGREDMVTLLLQHKATPPEPEKKG